MQLNGTPEGVYRSLTKHLFSYVEVHVTACQFPSHSVFLCQMCCNSRRPDRLAPLPLLCDRLPPSCSPSVARDLTGQASSFSPFSPVVILLLISHFPFHPCTSPSSTPPYPLLRPPPPMSTNYGGWGKGSTKTLSGPPTDLVPPFTEPSFLAIRPSLVFWLGPRPPRHKGLIVGYNWLGYVTHLWDSPLPVPPCPPHLFVFGLLLKNWASNLVTGQRGKQSVSVCSSSQSVIKTDIVWSFRPDTVYVSVFSGFTMSVLF